MSKYNGSKTEIDSICVYSVEFGATLKTIYLFMMEQSEGNQNKISDARWMNIHLLVDSRIYDWSHHQNEKVWVNSILVESINFQMFTC